MRTKLSVDAAKYAERIKAESITARVALQGYNQGWPDEYVSIARRAITQAWATDQALTDTIRVHAFPNTKRAYNASQTDDTIRDGDVLVAEQEKLTAVLVGAWPTAANVTGEWIDEEKLGQFHGLDTTLSWATFEEGRYVKSAAAALQEAVERGWI